MLVYWLLPSPYLIAATTLLLPWAPAGGQTLPFTIPETMTQTPQEEAALLAFRPHAEELCRVLYPRPTQAENCLQRVLDAALPLALAPTVPPSLTGPPRIDHRGSTVAPDGRE